MSGRAGDLITGQLKPAIVIGNPTIVIGQKKTLALELANDRPGVIL